MDSGKGIKGWELNPKKSTLEDDITHCFSSKIDCWIEVGKFAGAERGPACHDGGQALGREGEGRQEGGRDREGRPGPSTSLMCLSVPSDYYSHLRKLKHNP